MHFYFKNISCTRTVIIMDGNFLTFIQHNKNIKYSWFLNRLKQSVYTPIISLEAWVCKSNEPLPFDEVKGMNFDRIRSGDNWGGFLTAPGSNSRRI